MRVTFNMMTDTVTKNLTNSASSLMEAQSRAATGKLITKPSDDVTGTSSAMRMRSSISSLEQYEEQSDIAKSQLTMTSSALNTIVDDITRARTLGLQGATDALSEESRQSIATQIDQIMESLAAQGNTQYNGKYLFSGGATDTEPMVEDTSGTNPYNYAGDSSQFTIEIAAGTYITANVTADQVFNMNGSAVSSSPDVFTTLKNLRDKILAGDVDAVSAAIGDVDTVLANASSIRSQVGGRLSRIESVSASVDDSKTALKTLLSETENADTAEAIIDVTTANNVYEAAISVSKKLLNLSLTDYLS